MANAARDYTDEDLDIIKRLASIFAIAVDRKRMEEDLRLAKDFNESVINTSQAIIVILSKRGEIIRFNPYMEELSGYTLEEVKGKDWFGTFLPNDYEKIQTSGYVPMMTKDGRELLIEWHDKTLKDENDYILGVLLIGQDITEREMVQTKLEELVQELRSTNEQLKQSQEQLVQSEKMRSLGQLVAGIAHEINNPLGFLITNTNNLMKFVNSFVTLIETFNLFDIPQDVRTNINAMKEELNYEHLKVRTTEMIERSRIGLDRIKNVVSGLKTYSRMDRSEILETDINESISVTLSLLTHEFRDRITIVTDYGDIPLIKCYSSQLNQVFMNILINACHAIEGEGEIKIKTSIENDMLRIDISDTGKGIPLEIQDRLFDPFFTTKPIGEGTGLGLSISLGIIKKHKGDIVVESTEGKGTTFTITLPLNPNLA
ncbi:multi-sensor signal transduction histidine kinase [Candidatus Magnetobacterium bavaricum]|uniref:histidine kinase n=1 Tax=Candidatus Magnetobacterium bavaricum TaxID=29290 RepID=A0A0F3H102_9BACT|nr:multi-sensor signal transduction histidine kinase [Candidatus Magnetobacterium bavaricum]